MAPLQITTSCTQVLWQYVKAGKISDTVASDLGGQLRDIQNNFFTLYATTEQPVRSQALPRAFTFASAFSP